MLRLAFGLLMKTSKISKFLFIASSIADRPLNCAVASQLYFNNSSTTCCLICQIVFIIRKEEEIYLLQIYVCMYVYVDVYMAILLGIKRSQKRSNFNFYYITFRLFNIGYIYSNSRTYQFSKFAIRLLPQYGV